MRRTPALAFVVATASIAVAACGPADTEPTPTSSATSSGTSATSTPPTDPIPVNAGSLGTRARTVQAWADDVAAGRMDDMVRKCWTHHPETVHRMYSQADVIRPVLATAPAEGQAGPIWRLDDHEVLIRWGELDSPYPCPDVITGPRRSEADQRDDAVQTVRRALLRATGTPIDPADVETTNPLACQPFGFWQDRLGHPAITSIADAVGPVHTFDEHSFTTEIRPPGPGGDRDTGVKVTVDGKPWTFLVSPQLTGPCIPDITK